MPFAHVSLDDMNKEVLAWDIYQMLTGSPMYTLHKVPVNFTSIDQYLDIFEPLLLEECRAQILRSMNEQENPAHKLRLLAVEPADPFRIMRFEAPVPVLGEAGMPAPKPAFFETDLVFVSYEPLDLEAARAVREAEDEGEEGEAGAGGQEFHALALVSGAQQGKLQLKLYVRTDCISLYI